MKKWQSILYPVISVAFVVALWSVIAGIVGVEFLLPSPSVTFGKLFKLLSQTDFYVGLGTTVLHSTLSFCVAFAAAGLFAVLASVNRIVERILSPIVLIVRVAPTMSVIFLSILWIGLENSPYLVCVFVLFPMLYSRILSAIASVDPELLEMAKAYRVGKGTIVKMLYLPHVSNSISNECPALLSFSVKLAVSGEAVARGGINIGSLMQSANAVYETAELLAYTVAAVLLGLALEWLVKGLIILIRRLTRNAEISKNNKKVRQ